VTHIGATGNDDATAANGGASQHVSEEDAVKMTWKMNKAKSLTGGGATCEFIATNGQTAIVTIRGLRAVQALAQLQAMERVLNGALVLDGDDLRRIDASLLAMADKAGPGTKGYLLDLRVPIAKAVA
jgi:hypothetical protein